VKDFATKLVSFSLKTIKNNVFFQIFRTFVLFFSKKQKK